MIQYKPLAVKADPKLKAGIRDEGPYILNWALQGLRDLREAGNFVIPATVARDTEAWARDNNVLGLFFDECFTDGDKTLRAGQIHRLYVRWCSLHGYKALSLGEFGKRARRVEFYADRLHKPHRQVQIRNIDLSEEGHKVNESGYNPVLTYAEL